MKGTFAFMIVAAMVLGVGAGWFTHEQAHAAWAPTAIMIYGLLPKIFIMLIKMIIAPLVLSTLVTGVGHMEDAASVGRIGLKTLGWFLCMSIISLLIGMVVVEWLQPGAGITLASVAGEAAPTTPSTTSFTLDNFIDHVIPTSIFKAMADNEVLQIVIFGVFVGTAVSSLEKGAPQVMALAEQVSNIMLKVTATVMKFAPFGIFGALAQTVAQQGLPILLTYAKFVGGFYGGLAILWGVLILFGLVFAGRRIFKVLSLARDPALLSFATASSEAAYPRVLASLPQAGVSRKIVSFVLPLGYAFNLDGSMMYCTFATLFIAQAHHISFSLGQKALLMLILIVTSKGIAGVPKASLVVIMAAMAYFGLPATWIALVMGVDHLLDMGRSATNVIGNSVAATVVARWEGQLGEPEAVEG